MTARAGVQVHQQLHQQGWDAIRTQHTPQRPAWHGNKGFAQVSECQMQWYSKLPAVGHELPQRKHGIRQPPASPTPALHLQQQLRVKVLWSTLQQQRSLPQPGLIVGTPFS